MPEHSVKYHIQTAFVSLVDETAELIFGAEVRVDLEIVVGEVAGGLQFLAAGCCRRVEDRSQPDGVGTERLYVVERSDDAGKIAVLLGSLCSGILGSILITLFSAKKTE